MATLFRHVFFDVDSTLVTIEGIDVLAGGNPEIAKLTEAAMNGEIPLDQVYARRLEMIRPTRDAVDALGTRYVDSLVEGVEETFGALYSEHVLVHLLTAGIAQAIQPLAMHLGVPPGLVHAVELQFNERGEYVDFDRRSPLTYPRGKELVVRNLRARSHGKVALVGDGVSDLETRPVVDLFIGFGGVCVRQRVRDNASVYVTTMRDLLRYLVY